MNVNIRQAQASDAAAMHRVRMSVAENRLTSVLVLQREYVTAVEEDGRGWVAELDGAIVGFAVGNLKNGNVWALFVEPAHEGKGCGRQLHDIMVTWLWGRGLPCLWLTTESGTRAERFYRRNGWKCVGTAARGEIRFELHRPNSERLV